MGTNELSMRLWRERELLEFLLFKLEEQDLLLAAGSSRWIQFATREIEQVLDRLRTAGVERAIEADVVAAEWGAPEGSTLRALIEQAPSDAWRDVFSDHLRVLTQLTAEIGRRRDAGAEQLRSALLATQETIAGVDGGGQYTQTGRRAAGTDTAHLIDTQM